MSSKNNTPACNINNNNNNNNIRKYLVLLHDCLAIKFIPLTSKSSTSQLPPVIEPGVGPSTSRDTRPKPISQSSQNKSSTSTIQSPRRTTPSDPARDGHGHYDDEDADDNDYEEDYDNKGDLGKSFINKRKQLEIGKSSSSSTSSRQVDQSLKGLLLYKEFRDINLSCFWNSALQQSFEKLEYKGTVVPSTILVGSPIRRHLTILKTAFSRKMLKCPEGFQIEFVGEIEELIADPIEKSHFIPLSDSLCWAIHELTSSGQEAFVDEILMELTSAFPETVLPPKELIYQILERLTKERKVYQTSQGYFVVTPDTHRYIVNTDPSLMLIPSLQSSNHFDSNSNGYHLGASSNGNGCNEFVKGRLGTLDSLKSKPPVIPEIPDDDLNEHLDVIDHYEEVQPAHMKRCNSLRNSMKRSDKVSGCLPRRTFSMRSTKSRSKDNSSNPNIKTSRLSLKDSVLSLDVYGVGVNDQTVTRRQKHKSFLKKLLTFRRSRKGSKKDNANEIGDNISIEKEEEDGTINLVKNETLKIQPINTKTMLTMSMSTQTSNSVENLPSSFGLLSIANPNCNSSTKSPEPLDSDSGRYTESSASSASPQSEVDIEISNVTNNDDMIRSNTPSPHQSDHQEQLGSVLKGDKSTRQIQSRRGHHSHSLSYESSSPSPSYRSGSGCDTLGNNYKWTPPTLSPNLQSRCTSSASSSVSSYRDLFNKYRRKSPSYQQQQLHNYNNHNHSHRQCHTLGSTGYVTPPPVTPLPSKLLSPFRYPPRPYEKKQIYKEMSHRSSQNKVDFDLDGRTSGTINNTNTNNNDNMKVQGTGLPSSSTSTTTSMTTTVTQTLKNSTNLELELLFPLGKLISAALTDFEQKSDPKEPIKKHNDSNSGNTNNDDGDTGMIINNNENKQVHQNCKNPTSTNTAANSGSNTNTNTNDTNLKQKAEREEVISEAHTTTTSTTTTTVNDLFTINCKSFIRTNLNNDGLTSTIEFKTTDNPVVSSSKSSNTNTCININNINNMHTNNSNINKPKGSLLHLHLIEPVSFKPFRFTNFESKECRESEII